MSEFGFDAYALDELDTVEHPHPLEIARDLIANGRARAALEILSEQHEALEADPEYLLLCSEAWLAEGDELRAQQALLGAARLAPDDPRPLLWLGELLIERGEQAKAERVLAKARALEARSTWAEAPDTEVGPEVEDDLIAFAEKQERGAQAALSSKQVLLAVFGLVVIALIVAGIAFLTSPANIETPPAASGPESSEASPEASDAIIEEPPAELEAAEAESMPEPLPEPELPPTTGAEVASETAPIEAAPEQAPVATVEARVAAQPKPERQAAQTSSRKAAPARRESIQEEPKTKEPSPALVQAELASMTPRQLTVRADALYAQGHTGVAASYYRRALEVDPDYAPALVGMGQGILRAKKYSEAMRNATRALHLARGVDARPGLEAVAIYQMGRVHYERGERDAARRLFRQSISLPGTPSEAWFYLGEALSSDNSPAAREAYEKYLELVPKGHLADRARRAIQ